jgi:two-component system chemotaxis response regulator CheY
MRLLVVDDSFTMRKMLVRSLQLAGMKFDEVLEANDGLEALGLIGRDPPNLIICDINMPKLDGLKFLAAVRKQHKADRVKMVILTSKAAKSIEENAMRAGCNGFFAKPFVAEELAKKLEEILRAQP